MKTLVSAFALIAVLGCSQTQESDLNASVSVSANRISRHYRANADAETLLAALGGSVGPGISSEQGHIAVGCEISLPSSAGSDVNQKKLECTVLLNTLPAVDDGAVVTIEADRGRGTLENHPSAQEFFDRFTGLKADSKDTKSAAVSGATITMKKSGENYSVEMVIEK